MHRPCTSHQIAAQANNSGASQQALLAPRAQQLLHDATASSNAHEDKCYDTYGCNGVLQEMPQQVRHKCSHATSQANKTLTPR